MEVATMIEIHYSTAEEVATKMENAADALQSAMKKVVTKDEQSTVTVNDVAKDSSDQAVNICHDFHSEFLQSIQNIQSIVTEFKRVDQESSESMNTSVIQKDTNNRLQLR